MNTAAVAAAGYLHTFESGVCVANLAPVFPWGLWEETKLHIAGVWGQAGAMLHALCRANLKRNPLS